MLGMPLQSATDEPSTTGSGRDLTGAKGAGIEHQPDWGVGEPPSPKNWPLATRNLLIVSIPCKCFPAYCPIYFLPPSPPLTLSSWHLLVFELMRKKKGGHKGSARSTLTLDFCCIWFQVPECFWHINCSTSCRTDRRPAKTRPPFIHVGLVCLKAKVCACFQPLLAVYVYLF